jgi:hypothetical protein
MFFNKKRPNVQFINQIGKKAEFDAKRVPYVFDDFINEILFTDIEIPREEINNIIHYQQKTNFFLNAGLTMFHHGWMTGYVKRHYKDQLDFFIDELAHELENIHGPNFKSEIEKAIRHRKLIVYIATFMDQLYELGYNLGSQSEYIERREM